MNLKSEKFAPFGLIVGCVVFSLGSVIVAFVPVGAYAITFWRLLIAAIIFYVLKIVFKHKLPSSSGAKINALLAGVFLSFDLSLWHESIYAVGPGISTLLNSMQIFWLALIGFLWFNEKLTLLQSVSLILAFIGVALIGSPEFKHNIHALWGFVSGILSSLFLAISMSYVRKTHQIEKTSILSLMLLISVGSMAG